MQFRLKYGDELTIQVKHRTLGPKGKEIVKRYEFPQRELWNCGTQTDISYSNAPQQRSVSLQSEVDHSPKKRVPGQVLTPITDRTVQPPSSSHQSTPIPSAGVSTGSLTSDLASSQTPTSVADTVVADVPSTETASNTTTIATARRSIIYEVPEASCLPPVVDLPGKKTRSTTKVSRKASNMNKNKCAKCGSIYRKKDDKLPSMTWLGCDCGNYWVHAKCIGIAIARNTNIDDIPLKCPECMSNSSQAVSI